MTTVSGLNGITDTAVRCTTGDVVGSGLFEFGVFGVNQRYGFAGPEDLAL